jgi:methionyl-tRNA formyltransferase
MIRVEFLTAEDSLYILPFFEEFLGHYQREFKILQISCAPIMGSRPKTRLARELMSLYGVCGLSRLLARHAYSKILSSIPRGPNATRYHSVEQACHAYGIAYAKITNPNSEEFVRAAEQRRADVIISVACPYILKNQLLNVPPLGCINIHHALLPRYRGMMPTFWQLYHGEKKVGLTIHRMAEALDTGKALFQGHLAVFEGETLDHLIRRSKRHAAHELTNVLHRLGRSECATFDLPREGGSYFTFPTRQQIREFHARGLKAI